MILTSGCAHKVERINSLYDSAYLLPFFENFSPFMVESLTKAYIIEIHVRNIKTKRIALRQVKI